MGVPLSPTHALFLALRGQVLFTAIPLVALSCFGWTIYRRLLPLWSALPDARFNNIAKRCGRFLRYWLLQWKHPRYLLAGLLHIVIFVGFVVLSIRSLSLVLMGIFPGFDATAILGPFSEGYRWLKDYAATAVFAAVILAAVRRALFNPQRYAPRPGDRRNHTAEALTVLGLIALLMLSESVFGSGDRDVARFTLAAGFRTLTEALPVETAATLRLYAYVIHELTFFAFLCYLPFGKHFHVLTSGFQHLLRED